MKKQITKYIICGCAGVLLIIVGLWNGRQQRLQQELAEKVLRFHVLANSDKEEDQNLKLKVRDAIGSYMQEEMKNMESKQECVAFIGEKLPEIEQVAMHTVLEEGFSYNVQAKLTKCEFPEKNYGRYTFPPGTYDALRVTIGEGEGQNWWCVMYPNMCFANSMYEVSDEEEYNAVLQSGDYELRLWFLEIFR